MATAVTAPRTSTDDVTRRSRARFTVGDPLRGIAALAVAVGHVIGLVLLTWQTDGRGVGLPPDGEGFGTAATIVSSFGTAGVSVFFVLSGYLLSRPFVRAFVLGDDRPSAPDFVRNRVVRIVPAYWAMLVVLLLVLAAGDLADLSADDVAGVTLFDTTLPPSLTLWLGQVWTLGVELRFYLALLVVGTLLVLAGRRAGPRLPRGARVAVLVAALAALAAWSFLGHPLRSTYFATTFEHTVGRFTAGVLLAIAEVVLVRAPGRRLLAAAPALFAAGGVALVLVAYAYDDPGVPLGQTTQWLITLAAGLVVGAPLLWQWAGHRAWAALDNRVLRWAGSRSYSIYLVHFPIYAGLLWALAGDSRSGRVVLLAVVGLPCALAAAEVLHRAVERPALGWRAPSQAAPVTRGDGGAGARRA